MPPWRTAHRCIRDASKIKGRVDWAAVDAALIVLHGAKQRGSGWDTGSERSEHRAARRTTARSAPPDF